MSSDDEQDNRPHGVRSADRGGVTSPSRSAVLAGFAVGALTVLGTSAGLLYALSSKPDVVAAIAGWPRSELPIKLEAFDPRATVAKWESISTYSPSSLIRTVGDPVGKITVTWDSGLQSNCTGTVVAARLVLTAAHCANRPVGPLNQASEIESIALIMAYDEPGDRTETWTQDGRMRRFSMVHVPLEYVFSDAVDYALFRTSPDEEDPAEIWGQAELSTNDLTPEASGRPLVIIHHPKRITTKQVTRYGCYTNGRRWGPSPNDPTKPIGHNCDTIGGSSGAPLFLADDYTIVGIHRGAPGISRVGQAEEAPSSAGIDKPLNLFSGIRDIAKRSRVIASLMAERVPAFRASSFEVPADIDYSANYRSASIQQIDAKRAIGRLGAMQVLAEGTLLGMCNGISLDRGYILMPLHCLTVADDPTLVFGALAASDLLQSSRTTEQQDDPALSPWFEASNRPLLASSEDDFAVVESTLLGVHGADFRGLIDSAFSISVSVPTEGAPVFLHYFGPSEDLRRVECKTVNVTPPKLEYVCASAEGLEGSSGGILLGVDDKIVGMHQSRGPEIDGETIRTGLLMASFETQWSTARLDR